MNYSLSLRKKIMYLRKQGNTYPEICTIIKMSIPKSSLSYICKEVLLDPLAIKLLKNKEDTRLTNVRKLAFVANREKLNARLELHTQNAKKIVNGSNNLSLKLALAMLYWGEGSKWASYRGLSLGSSELSMVSTYINLLQKCYGLKKDSMSCRLMIRADQNAELLEKYWSESLLIPRSSFYKTYVDARTLGKPTRKSGYKGVCVVSCAGTDVQLELAAIANEIAKMIKG